MLSELDEEVRVRLLVACGTLARPGRLARSQYRKSRRQQRRDELRAADQAVLDRTRIRNQRIALVYPTPAPPGLPGHVALDAEDATDAVASESDAATETVGRLRTPRSCYICKTDYQEIHVFYDALCPTCAVFNLGKREQTADLTGRAALLTGGRVKIGYQVGIKLLRAGAELIVTTRFPRDAATRYASEPDFSEWRDRLQIHGLDLRHTPSVEALSRHLLKRAGRLDFVVNNACQTVRRPPGFYAHLMEGETLSYDELDSDTRQVLSSHEALRDAHLQLAASAAEGASSAEALTAPDAATQGTAAGDAAGLTLSAALSQVMLVKGDSENGSHLFPEATLDADLQQVDLRTHNSWRLALDEVPTVELLEVHLVNAVAPFVLAARLKPLMVATTDRDKHIVNVSAMEGQFYRAFKTDKHPHTNMAKASLNMLTRTSAPDYQRDGIHMNSVDTGWITDEDPAQLAESKRIEHGFYPPLDHVDAAARILDPIFAGMATGEHLWGQFLKDYKPAPW
ncbi:MAG: NAD(P)-dependent dehydrogenase (short-subunit alcohol dehydrogenase family) [Pseudohongiellaceae bacterium]|jgi:NAD(P)-dependent dehydrogenase (short-subunit alcohol dehydrogenase family)